MLPVYVSKKKVIQDCGGGRFCKGGPGACPPENLEKYTLNNAFWRHLHRIKESSNLTSDHQ